jgi:hypothetical protein
MQVLLIGLGAGIASALLFVSLASGSTLSIALFYLAPLPIMLAGIGWSHAAALIAMLTAAVGLGVGAGFWFLLAYLATVGIPAYILSYLAMLARTSADGGDLEWYPAGRIVLWAAVIATGTTALTIPAFGFDIETYRATLRQVFDHLLHLQLGIPAGQDLKLPNGSDAGKVLELLVLIVPPMAAALAMVTNLFNLWIAGRIARASGKLARPWPDLSAIGFPNTTPILLLGTIALSYFLSSLVGAFAGVLAACLLMAYAILGLAVLHTLTRRLAARGLVLSVVWMMVLGLGWPLVVVALIGLAEGLLDLRGRMNPPNPNFPNQPKH